MPSYSLLLIISSVWKKCFLLASTDAESCWLPARLEWMSSISPLRYFVVTCFSLCQHTLPPPPTYQPLTSRSGYYSPIRCAGQNSRHICPKSPQTAQCSSPSPCTSRPRAAPAGDTRARASRRGRAAASHTPVSQHISPLQVSPKPSKNNNSPLPPPPRHSPQSASPTTNDSPDTRRGTGPAS
jgi:hypothetical protein